LKRPKITFPSIWSAVSLIGVAAPSFPGGITPLKNSLNVKHGLGGILPRIAEAYIDADNSRRSFPVIIDRHLKEIRHLDNIFSGLDIAPLASEERAPARDIRSFNTATMNDCPGDENGLSHQRHKLKKGYDREIARVLDELSVETRLFFTFLGVVGGLCLAFWGGLHDERRLLSATLISGGLILGLLGLGLGLL
jgi:hypothetical protein